LGDPISFPAEVVVAHGAFGGGRDDRKKKLTIFSHLVLQLKVRVDSGSEALAVEIEFTALRLQ
jgi:hypothetical protein